MTNFSNIIEKLDEMIYKPNNLLITKRKEEKQNSEYAGGYSS